MITETQKTQIAERLKDYVERIGSQNKAANSLKISTATVSQILNNNWELVSDEMWRSIAAHIGHSFTEWTAVETRDYKMLNNLLADAQNYGHVFAVTGEAGTGKSFTVKGYTEANKRVYTLQCAEYWNRKVFLQELLTAMGRDYSGFNVAEMMYEAVRTLKVQEKPLIILDEADKLTDQVLYFFITLYNQLEDHCGIVLLATDHLAKRIRRGLKLNRKGYKEIYSRIARRFIELHGASSSDIAAICMANGITGQDDIKKVIEDAEGDLRRARRKIHALKAA
ncbi:MAG: ATP-binding protein [Bacteroidales bacterium]|jgi:DNA transposition AAA+ family ATPase|nr:ATP-binding protein [Bacteroidales bacterium]